MSKGDNTKEIELREVVERDRVKQLIYAAWFCGYAACSEGKLPHHPDNLAEKQLLWRLVTKRPEDE